MASRRSVTCIAALTLAAWACPAMAQTRSEDEPEAGPLALDLIYKADLIAVGASKRVRGVRYLDNLDAVATLNLDRAAHWKGASAYVGILSNAGGRPNAIAGTLQGVNNIEVNSPDLLLYQAWVQQRFAGDRASLLMGKYDLNSEFYYNAAASQLIAPAFGIGSELAATGPNGPSIFPQTDLAVRLRLDDKHHYAQAAIVRAPRGTTDQGGRRSALFIAELGVKGRTAIGVGGWTYSHRQPRTVPPGVIVTADTAASHGLYALVERDLVGQADRPGHWIGFMRVGFSDGLTTPFGDGLQLGVAGHAILSGRPESHISFGFATAGISTAYRQSNPLDEAPLVKSETMVELTYSDRVAPFLTLQPDVQYVHRPSGLRDAPGVVVVGLRAIVDWKVF
ncbi:carbohydrate porin [uncultured Sphingomonas sp.]|uniref:carbohydrate porin n=1 Tax=uncultured Sphingomonas sp. TaxID=158754 RepID=UPI0025DFD05D|nr:carbohydrate porin [uncultured Sphingomonas sp.]